MIAACGGDDNTGQIDVNLEYPTEGARTITGSVHVWALQSVVIDDAVDAPGCAALIGNAADPYDIDFDRAFDRVFLQPDEPEPVADGLPDRALLVYVEAVDYTGATHLAGCAVSEGGSGSVTIALVASGTFDCGDAATENDARCDDGDLCTVGETCRSGRCQGGVARDCNFAADSCNAAECDSQIGCVTAPLSGVSCNDGQFCSSGEVCMDGACLGTDTDCSAVENGCRTGVCNEDFDTCTAVNFPPATACDLFCIVGGTCSSGNCIGGSARNCSSVADQCNSAACSESTNACIKVPLTPRPCNDSNACTTGEQCVVGQCTNAAVTDVDNDGYSPIGCPPDTIGSGDCLDGDITVNPGAIEGPMGNATCTDAKDNDCDGFTDAADPGCQS